MPPQPLALRLDSRSNTIRRFGAAATGRYRDRLALAEVGRRLGAIYLFGYAAEMVLKSAYFRLAGWADADPIKGNDLRAARDHAVSVLGVRWAGRYHDLAGWAGLLIQERLRRVVAYPPRIAHQLTGRVLAAVHASVTWLLNHRRAL